MFNLQAALLTIGAFALLAMWACTFAGMYHRDTKTRTVGIMYILSSLATALYVGAIVGAMQ